MLLRRILPVCLLFGLQAAQAQTPASPPAAVDKTSAELASHDTPTTFSTKVNLVMVPVVVRDRKGKAVGALQKEDFQLFDKGKPQVIAKFSVEKAEGRAVPIQVASPDTPGETSASPVAPLASRFIAYLFDDLHLAFGDLAQARDAAAKHLNESLDPATRAAIYTTSGQTMLDFTDDREKLQATLLQIQPRGHTKPIAVDCPDVSFYMADRIQNKNDPDSMQAATDDAKACMHLSDPGADLMAGQAAQAAASRMLSVGEMETQVALSVLKDMVRRVSAMPGQRTLVMVSSGFLVTQNYRQAETEILDLAIRSNVVISTLDARGLYTVGADASRPGYASLSAGIVKARLDHESALAEGEVLGELADGTGGTFFHNNNDLNDGFRRVAASPEFVYLMGFSPQNLKLDGSFHALKITLKNGSGLSLQARRGYYAPKHAVDPAEQAKQELREALFSREEMQDIPIELQTQFFKPTDVTAKLAVLARVDLKRLHFRKAEGRNLNTLTVVSGVFDRNGNYISGIVKTIEMRLKDETFEARLAAGLTIKSSFDVTPGNYVVRLVVRDAEGQTMSARNGAVQIP
jgi:VWFA-related protein